MTWPFSRKANAPERGPLNEDWRAGDLAQCVVRARWHSDEPGAPDLMDVLYVEAVYPGHDHKGVLGWGLRFKGLKFGYDAVAFKKLPPRSEQIARKTSVSTPVREKEPA